MKLHFLGTGTSTGVPQIGCHCPTCTSTDPRDKRLRASVLITPTTGKNLLIDCGPDFRAQILSVGAPELEALLVTHSHYDHVGGLDDLRPYCKGGRNFPTYCRPDVAKDLRMRNPWSFGTHLYPGVPTFEINKVNEYEPFTVGGVEVLPVQVVHGRMPILGYRIGSLAYITDCSQMPQRTLESLAGLDTLVINALRIATHPTHFSLAESLAVIEQLKPRCAYLTHLSHDMGPRASVSLPDGVQIAYDGLEIEISD